MGDGKISVLLNQNAGGPFAAWQEVDWLLIVLSAGLTLFGGLMIRRKNQGLTDWCSTGWWDWRLLNALYCLLPVRETDSVALDYLNHQSFPDRRDGDGYHRHHSGGSLSLIQPSTLRILQIGVIIT